MEQRTKQQNKALHKYCANLSEALNDAGLDMKATLKPEAEIPWTPYMVKEHLFKPIMKAMLGLESTTELSTRQVNEVYAVLNLHTAQKLGVSLPFPGDEE